MYPEVSDIKELQVLPFSRIKKYKNNMSVPQNLNYDELKKFFSEKELKRIFMKEPYIFKSNIDTLKNVLELIKIKSNNNLAEIISDIARKPSKLRELINSYEMLEKFQSKDINEEVKENERN